MSLQQLCSKYPWALYSKKLKNKLSLLRCMGAFSDEEAQSKGLRLVSIKKGTKEEGCELSIYWLLDEEDASVVDAKFQAFAPTALLGAAEAACMLSIGKTYEQASRIGADMLDAFFQDKHGEEAFPTAVASQVNLVVEALEGLAASCSDVPLPAELKSPLPSSGKESIDSKQLVEDFEKLSLKAKLQLIKDVVEKEIQPFVALDGGGVEVLNLMNGNEVIIAYQGACVGCFSAVGSTLNSIQQILQQKVHPSLIVTPEL